MYTDDWHLSPLMTGGVPRFVVNRFIVDTVNYIFFEPVDIFEHAE